MFRGGKDIARWAGRGLTRSEPRAEADETARQPLLEEKKHTHTQTQRIRKEILPFK